MVPLSTQSAVIPTSTSLPLSALLSPFPGLSPKRRLSVASVESEEGARPHKSPRREQVDSAYSQAPEELSVIDSHTRPLDSVFAAPSIPTKNAQTQRMRSSIACVRCRRSKVKCVNSGVHTSCRSCEASGRECTYPVPVPGGRRRDSSISGPFAARPEDGGDSEPKRQRPRKSIVVGLPPQLSAPFEEKCETWNQPLDPDSITAPVWQELFDIFQVHFSTDLPFLHPPTFSKPLRQGGTLSLQYGQVPNATSSTARPSASPELLLAFLALTARYHPRFVAHHPQATSPDSSNVLAAAEHYATNAFKTIAGKSGEKLTNCSLERTQALLMLSLYELSMCRGSKAWSYLGLAVRSAQMMGLQYEQDLDDQPLSLSIASDMKAWKSYESEPSFANIGDAFVQQEVRRRTLWSCFLMDRHLSTGKYRPRTLHVADLRVQLPASERAYLFGEQVRTSMLGAAQRESLENEHRASVLSGSQVKNGNGLASLEHIRLETREDEGLLSQYTRVMDIYSSIVAWTVSGGRRYEQHPPWHPSGKCHQLLQALSAFRTGLPRNHQQTSQNTSAHINMRTASPYALVHIAHSLSRLLIHREYLAFAPLRCSEPKGPLNHTLSDIQGSSQYWRDSAATCLAEARNIVDLIRALQSWEVMVETPIVGFALYMAAVVTIYCTYFPLMDLESILISKTSQGTTSMESYDTMRRTLGHIAGMGTRLPLVDGWLRTVLRTHRFYARIRKDYAEKAYNGRNDGPGPQQRSSRDGTESSWVANYDMLEKMFNNLGLSMPEDHIEMTDASPSNDRPRYEHAVEGSESGSPTNRHEANGVHRQGSDTARQEERWNAINSVAAAATPAAPSDVHTPSRHPSDAHFRAYSNNSATFQTSYPNERTSPAEPAPLNNFRPAYPQSAAWTTTNGNGQHATVPRNGSTVESTSRRGTNEKWTAAETESWIHNLESIPFGGDDVAAFVEGADVKDYAKRLAASPAGEKSWLAVVWQSNMAPDPGSGGGGVNGNGNVLGNGAVNGTGQ